MWFKHITVFCATWVKYSLYEFSIYWVRLKLYYCLSLVRGKTFIEVGFGYIVKWLSTLCASPTCWTFWDIQNINICLYPEIQMDQLPLKLIMEEECLQKVSPLFTVHLSFIFEKKISSELYHFSWEPFRIFMSIRRWRAWESTMLTHINMQHSVPFARMLINT